MYNITRPLAARGYQAATVATARERGEGGRDVGQGGSTQFIKESTARNLRLLLTLGCRNLCELLTKEWRSFRSRTHYHEPTSGPSPSPGAPIHLSVTVVCNNPL